MRLGITGTQRGFNTEQRAIFLHLLKMAGHLVEFHHGCCIGVDHEAWGMVLAYRPETSVHFHPSSDTPAKQVKYANYVRASDVVHEPLPALMRNRSIVDAATLMVAFPHEEKEILRSGTWSTIRYARKRDAVILVFTEGTSP